MEKVDSYEILFVDYMPNIINQGILYISMQYTTAIHLCACGCGEKVVTPLSPDDWKLTFNGETISLYPSIGNWNFPCRSHYWIKNSQVVYAYEWDSDKPKKKKSKKKKFFQFWKK